MAASHLRARSFPTTWPTEARARESTGQISVASPLLATNSTHRGCVSQTISAAGNDSRSPATAGKVCTMSPSEPRRTIRSRRLTMPPFSDGVEKGARRMIFGVAHNGNADAKSLGDCAFWNSFRGIVGTFGVHVRAQFLE